MKTVKVTAAALFEVPDDWTFETAADGQTVGLIKPNGVILKPLVALEVEPEFDVGFQPAAYHILCTDKHFKDHGIECIEYCDETGVEE